MLVEAGLLNGEQLKQAIVDHKRTNMKLGQYLVREGFVSGSQVADIISKQIKIKKYVPDNYPINIDLSNQCPGCHRGLHQHGSGNGYLYLSGAE